MRKQGDPEGRKRIQTAVELNPADADAQCEPGDACFQSDKKEALCCYEEAFKIAPTYPRALRSFIQCKVMRVRNIDFIALMRPNLEAAIETCREWITKWAFTFPGLITT